jgi:hypothetical protein
MPKLNLDERIHRIIVIGDNLSANAGFTVVPGTDATGNFLTNTKGGGAPRKIRCSFFFTPPTVGTKIKQLANGHQHECPLNTDRRTFELGNELSSTPGVSVVFINREDTATGTFADQLLLSDSGGDEIIDISGTKIPPNTGQPLVKPRTAAVKKKKAAPKKKKAAPKKKKAAAKKK